MSDDNYDVDPSDEPALKGFSRTAEMVKHFAGKTLKGGVLGAVIGGALLAGGAMAIGTMLGFSLPAIVAALWVIPVVGPVLSIAAGIGAPLMAYLGGGSLIMSTLTTGAIAGGLAGGAIGATTGLLGAGDAADEQMDKRLEQQDRLDARRDRREMLEMRREQQHIARSQMERSAGLSPGNMPYNQGMGGQRLPS